MIPEIPARLCPLAHAHMLTCSSRNCQHNTSKFRPYCDLCRVKIAASASFCDRFVPMSNK